MSGTRKSGLLGRIAIVLVICCVVMVGLCVNTAVALDGSGTQEDPWLIQSLEDFNDFASDANYWDDYTRLETDVNLAGRVYTTAVIAPDVNNVAHWFQGTAFTGVFDGNNHKIINLTISDGGAGNEHLGLFGRIDEGQVSNLGIEGGSISGYWRIGGLVGDNNYGSVSNCYSTGDANGIAEVGGLVGNYGSVSNCYSTGSVSGDERVGGLVGFNMNSVSNCYSSGSVSGDEDVGGLVGRNFNFGSVLNCYSTGDVSGPNYVGGLVGTNDGGVSCCYATGDVYSVGLVGGLVGRNYYGSSSISNCFWDTDTQIHGVTDSIGLNEGTATNVHGLPTSQLHQQSTFTNWDFINVWDIGENQTYPYLRRFLAGDINKDGIVNFLDFAIIAGKWMEEYNMSNRRPEVSITYPEDGDRLMVGGVPPQTMIMVEADDYDGTVVRVEFFDDELKLGEDSDGSDGWNYLWQGYSLGWHVLTATAWDEEGLSGTSAPVNVEVWMPYPPPP